MWLKGPLNCYNIMRLTQWMVISWSMVLIILVMWQLTMLCSLCICIFIKYVLEIITFTPHLLCYVLGLYAVHVCVLIYYDTVLSLTSQIQFSYRHRWFPKWFVVAGLHPSLEQSNYHRKSKHTIWFVFISWILSAAILPRRRLKKNTRFFHALST